MREADAPQLQAVFASYGPVETLPLSRIHALEIEAHQIPSSK